MRAFVTRSLTLALGMSLGLLHGQTTSYAYISSSYTVTTPSGYAGSVYSLLSLGVAYPTGLAPSSYVTSTQLNTDFQSFISAYPNVSDPPEAILSTVLQSVLGKYPQIVGGTLIGEISGPGTVIGTITIPGAPIGTIEVVIGTFNGVDGVPILSRSKPIPSKVKPVAPTKAAPASN